MQTATAVSYTHLLQTPERYDLFARAIEIKTELQIDDLESIIDGAFVDEEGHPITDAQLLASRLKAAESKVKLRQWRASKRMPHRFGDKMQHDHTGNVSITVVTGLPELPVARMLDDDGPRPGVLTYRIGDAAESGDAEETADSADSVEPASLGYASARLLDE